MPDEKKRKHATEMTTEEAAHHLFGKDAVEHLKRVAREQESKGKQADDSSQE
jgi:hypothetical protein